jgi:hypothetical protein
MSAKGFLPGLKIPDISAAMGAAKNIEAKFLALQQTVQHQGVKLDTLAQEMRTMNATLSRIETWLAQLSSQSRAERAA